MTEENKNQGFLAVAAALVLLTLLGAVVSTIVAFCLGIAVGMWSRAFEIGQWLVAGWW